MKAESQSCDKCIPRRGGRKGEEKMGGVGKRGERERRKRKGKEGWKEKEGEREKDKERGKRETDYDVE